MLTQADDSLAALRSLFNLSFVAAIVGAVVDRRYKKRGGVRPSRQHLLYLGVAGVACIALLVLLGAMGANARWLGRRLWDLCVLLFVLWELWRWSIRRAHPLNRAQPH